jgi:putative transposase
MARSLRIDFPETFYHVLSRGNERREIFCGDDDYKRFLHLIGRMVERFGLEVHAYVLMNNHYHLLVKTKKANLSRAVQWLGVSYSVWFNRRYQRSGHLFQGRFKSFLIQNETYFAAMCMYIHGNPLRAGVAEELADYPWSSYHAYCGKASPSNWLNMESVLALYGGNHRRFVREQEIALEKGGELLQDLHDGLYLGTPDFAEECLKKANNERHREKPQFRALLSERDIKQVAIKILEKIGEKNPISALSSRRRGFLLRDVAVHILYESGIYRNTDIGSAFGVGYTAISEAAKRGRKYLEADRDLAKKATGFLIDN